MQQVALAKPPELVHNQPVGGPDPRRSSLQNKHIAFLRSIAAIVGSTMILMILTQTVQAQTYRVIYNFSGGRDGAAPEAGVVIDRAGNLYGTTSTRGAFDVGTVFKLAPRGSGWILSPLYSFTGGDDGQFPAAPVTIGPDGNLYGITFNGGNDGCELAGCGTVFKLTFPARACEAELCPWTETVLYRFTGSSDGANPTGDVIFDAAGNIYGTTQGGGSANDGTVFKLTHSGSSWTESALHSFNAQTDGRFPQSGVIFDSAGNLYGTAMFGGPNNDGTAFELTPSGSSWTENTIYSFTGESDGAYPVGGLIFDLAGDLYDSTSAAGPNSGGTAFELSPLPGAWTFTMLYGLACSGDWCNDSLDAAGSDSAFLPPRFSDSPGPQANFLMDAAGNLYGTTFSDGPYGCGSIFKLSPSGGGWIYTSLHDFTGGTAGCMSAGNVAINASGNLFGTASIGGTGSCTQSSCGIVWEITP